MKKFLWLIVLSLLLLSSCGGEIAETTSAPNDTEPVVCQHEEVKKVVKKAGVFEDGHEKTICDFCGETLDEIKLPATNSIKILAIGNSFSQDATTYLYEIFKAVGVDEVIVGNAFISGCSIEKHYQMAQSGEAAYSYTKYTSSGSAKEADVTLEYMVANEEWDIITLQQASQYSGLPETYADLANLIDYVLDNCKNPTVDLKFHMTWAYEQSTNHGGFKNYNKDQMTMYNAIVNTVKSEALTKEDIEGVLPAGTAIQNLRTSYFGDTLTRDGYHLSLDVGRYTAGLTWACAITGASPYDVKRLPAACANIADDLDAIAEAVANAIATPFSVTDSTHTVKKALTLEERFTRAGLDINDYELLDWEPKLLYSWNAANSTKVGKSASMPQFTASKKFTKAELPTGTVIVVDEGYKYRPDAWQKIDEVLLGTRPSATTAPFTVVDDEWWGDFNYRAFNISKVSGSDPATEEDIKHFSIYVRKDRIIPEPEVVEPAKQPTDGELFQKAGLDINNYELVNWEPKLLYCWNASKSTKASKSASMPQFTASKKFAKDELPSGTVIIVDEGYKYRPDAWQTIDEVLSGTRPSATTALFTIVDDEWWGDFNYRGFNLSKETGSDPATEEDINHFRIYIPNK